MNGVPTDIDIRPRPAGPLSVKEKGIETKAYEYITKNKEKMMQKYDAKSVENPTVVFTAGGTGAGKTTGLRTAGIAEKNFIEIGSDNVKFDLVPKGMKEKNFLSKYSAAVHEPSSDFSKEIFSRRIGEKKNVIFDSNLVSDSASRRIKEALDSGAKVEIVYTHRPPMSAWFEGVQPRAERTGRFVKAEEHAMRHSLAPRKLLELHKEFGDKVRVSVIDNSGAKGTERLLKQSEWVDFIKGLQYNESNVAARIKKLGAARK